MSHYPRDEFDKVPENSARQGVHRSQDGPVGRSLAPVMVFGVLALLIGLAAFFLLPRVGVPLLSGSGTSAEASSSSVPAGSSNATSSATSSPTGSSSAGSPSTLSSPASPSASSSSSSRAAATDTAGVDRTVPVAIFDASGSAGTATRYGSLLATNGWTVSSVGTWAGAPQGSSSVVYNGTGQLANAQQLSDLLDIPLLLDSTELQVPLAVVLAPGA
jgi:hypothetical protein